MKALKDLTNEELMNQYDNPATKYRLSDIEEEMALRFMIYYRFKDISEYETRSLYEEKDWC